MSNIRAFEKIVEEICNEENINLNIMSDGWIMELNKDNKTKYIVGYRFDLNSVCTSEICNDKYALFSVLENSAIPVIKHNILFPGDEDKLKIFAEKYNYDVVLKPNNGTCGNNIYHLTDIKEIEEIYKRISKSRNVCICPFYNIKNEFRVIYLNGEIAHVYKKVKPVVVGNGKNTLRELLINFNEHYYSDEKNFCNDKYDVNYIPKDGELIEYEWRFNLSRGAIMSEASKEDIEILSKMALLVANKVNLKFGSIDIIRTMNDDYKIIEINSGVMMENLIVQENNGYEVAKRIYKKAIDLMFKI